MPTSADAADVARLIAECPPLDTNSLYCNLLQCSYFAETCVVAERSRRLAGWISGFRPPDKTDELFVWQVAVAAHARGTGLGGRMLDHLIARCAGRGGEPLHIATTITEGNAASWALFGALARRHNASFARKPLFERVAHFGGAHDTEHLVSIGPIAITSLTSPDTKIDPGEIT
ncbi:MAG: diaminobutyrate acetyltransferase [Rhodospirillaceae bacterium]